MPPKQNSNNNNNGLLFLFSPLKCLQHWLLPGCYFLRRCHKRMNDCRICKVPSGSKGDESSGLLLCAVTCGWMLFSQSPWGKTVMSRTVAPSDYLLGSGKSPNEKNQTSSRGTVLTTLSRASSVGQGEATCNMKHWTFKSHWLWHMQRA